MRAKGALAFAIGFGVLGLALLRGQDSGALPQQWFTKKSSAGSYATSAGAMVEKQLRPRGIDDPRVLRAMGKVPREKFVAPEFAANATKIGRCRLVSTRRFRSLLSLRS